MKKFSILIYLLVAFCAADAQSPAPTWGKQISCIVYSHCTSCHNPNGLAPSSFLTYNDAFNERFSILNAIVTNKMPPYLPDVTYNHLGDERVLNDAEKSMITNWVNAGAPAGDTSSPLPTPVYTSTQVITNPDLTARIPDFTIPNTGSDLYQAFVITNPNPTDQYITQIEVMPGNRSIVHHALVYQDTSYTPVANDSAAAGPGYVSFGGIGSNTARLIATWVPGSSVYTLPTGMGIKLSAGSRIVIQIHYPNGAAGQMDSTRINVKFDANPLRNVTINPILNMNNLTNGPLFIPADSVRTFYSKFKVPADVSVISIGPHAHLLCKKFEVYGLTPAGDTIRLIRINDWDFHWQGAHSFQKPVKLPAGTVLHGMAYYDNTVNNPDNPNSPPQDVSRGEATTDEMMLIYFAYLPYVAGDENIVIDTASHMAHYLDCVPEPLSLPVSFISFSAEVQHRTAVLHWATAQEKNNRYYDIERSTDGVHFAKIGQVMASLNGDQRNDYSYTDLFPENKTNYYRLKQVDQDGKFVYTSIRQVFFASQNGVMVYPNPVKKGQQIQLDMQGKKAERLQLINVTGQIVYSQTAGLNGIVNIAVPASIAAGQYTLRIVNYNEVETLKLVVE